MRVTTTTISFTAEGVTVLIGTVWCRDEEFVAIFGKGFSPAICATFRPETVKQTWELISEMTQTPLPEWEHGLPHHVIVCNLDKLSMYSDKEVDAIWLHEVGHIIKGDTINTADEVKAMDFNAKMKTEVEADRYAVREVGRKVMAKLLWKTANHYFKGGVDTQDLDQRFNAAKAYRGRLRALFGD